MSEWMANVAVGAAILLAGLGLLLSLVAGLSFKRLGSARLLWVALAFLGLAVQGVYLAVLAYTRRADVAAGTAGEFPILAVANLVVVFLLYLAVLKR